jgi:Carbohydrate esterase, sialic acid-specific acetylesterase
MTIIKLLLSAMFILNFCSVQKVEAQLKPVRVFILAGQSNMEGHATIETFDYIGDDPSTAPLLKQMRSEDGKPTVCDGAWISYLTGAEEDNVVIAGKLTAGYGSLWSASPGKLGDKIGPEFTFGLIMDARFDEPVLIIKTAWGGKSLHTDFRSPSAGPYQLSSFQIENYPKQEGHGIPADFEQWKVEKAKATGVYYRLMIEHVRKVLADLKQVIPGNSADQGYELAGFVWLQGFNDMVDHHVYPEHNTPDRFELYSELLAHFIRDVRKDLDAPKLPFVIGVMGVGGLKNKSVEMLAFRKAMAAPAKMPEFSGNVIAVETAPFWADELGDIDEKREKISQMHYFLDSKDKDHPNADGSMTEQQKSEYLKKYEAELISPAEARLWQRGASNAGYHYLGCAKTFAKMGNAFAEANLQMLSEYSLMHRCSIKIDREKHDAAYNFLRKGTGRNGYVWYGDGVSWDPDGWADMGRTGATGIANFLSPYDESICRERAMLHANVIGQHPQSFPGTHGSPPMGMAYTALAANVNPDSFRKLMDANRW